MVERVNQVIYNMLVSKDFDEKVFEYIYIWDKTIAYIAWKISASYLLTIGDTQSQTVISKDMISSLVSVIDW